MSENGASEEKESTRLTELKSEIEAARAAFINSVTQLREQTTPGALTQHGLYAVQGWFTDDFGAIRAKRVAITGAVVVGIIAIKLLRRRG